jgi:hypothetical protein
MHVLQIGTLDVMFLELGHLNWILDQNKLCGHPFYIGQQCINVPRIYIATTEVLSLLYTITWSIQFGPIF